MFLSKASEYAVRMVLYLSHHPGDEYVPIKTIADQTDIAYFKLGKVAQQLIKAGILHSYTGPYGGVALAKPPSEIMLYDIVCAIEGASVFDRCILGLEGCSEANPCTVHNHWRSIKESIMDLFQEKSLDELIDLETGRALLEID